MESPIETYTRTSSTDRYQANTLNMGTPRTGDVVTGWRFAGAARAKAGRGQWDPHCPRWLIVALPATVILGLADAPHGYEIFTNKENDCIKVVLKP